MEVGDQNRISNTRVRPRVSVIIAEKPAIAAAIARAFVPHDKSVEDFAWQDEFKYEFDKERRVPDLDRDRTYWQKDFSVNRRLVSTSSQTLSGRNTRSRRSISDDFSSKKPKHEKLTYYVIPQYRTSVDFILICDTQGNPLSQNIGTTKEDPDFALDYVTTCKSWDDYNSRFQLRPSSDGPWARMAWFRYVIARQSFPCDGSGFSRSDNFDLQRVYAATDYDTAGQYISYAVYKYCQQAYGGNFQPIKNLSEAMLVRLDISDLSPVCLRQAFEHPATFSWGMAFGGETRAKLDDMVGSFSSRYLNEAWRVVSQKFGLSTTVRKLPFGRVQTGTLNVLCDQYSDVTKQSAQSYLYCIFSGLTDWTKLQVDLRSRSMTWISVVETPFAVSQASLLKACQTKKIGTHTTRYTQFETLAANKLAVIDNRVILPTAFGIIYQNWLQKRFHATPFDMQELNKHLHDLIDSLKPVDDLSKSQALAYSFLAEFFEKYRAYLLFMFSEQQISVFMNDLTNLANELKSNLPDLAKEKHEHTVNVDSSSVSDFVGSSIVINGLTDCISPQTIQDMNRDAAAYKSVHRYISRPEIDYTSLIEQICCIDPGVSVGYLAWGNIAMLLLHDNFTVFKASFDQDVTPDIISKICIDATYEVIAVDNVDTEINEVLAQRPEIAAHQPLHLKAIRRSMIKGPTGLLLAREYQAPWKATIAKRAIVAAGKLLPKEFLITYKTTQTSIVSLENPHSFLRGLFVAKSNSQITSTKTSQIKFERIDRYQIGRVHNFESVLCAMSQFYNTPFHTTSKLMQEMYLS